MNKYIITLAAVLFSLSAFGQFRLASDGFAAQVSHPNDSTYVVDVNLFADLTGSGYIPTNIQTGYRLFSQRGQLYRISATSLLTFGSARLTIIEVDNEQVDTEGIPIGQVQVFDPGTVEAIPQVPYGTTGATAVLQAAVVSYNSLLPGGSEAGGGAAYVADYTALAAFAGDQSIVVVGDELTGGTFVADAGATVVDGGIVPVTGWRRQFEGPVKATWFGVDPSDLVDDSAALTDADDAAVAIGAPLALPETGVVVLEDVTIAADRLISLGCTIEPKDDVYDYILTFTGSFMQGVKVDQSKYVTGTGRKTAIRLNGTGKATVKDCYVKGPLRYEGSTSYAFDALKGDGLTMENIQLDSTDYGGIRFQTSDGKYSFKNIRLFDPRRNSLSALGRPTYLTRTTGIGDSVVYTSIPPRVGSVFVLDPLDVDTGEQGFTVDSVLVAGAGEWKVELSGALTAVVTQATSYITPMGALTIDGLHVERNLGDDGITAASGLAIIDPTISILQSAHVSNFSGNATIKFDYVENIYMTNSSIWVKNQTGFPNSAAYALSMEDMAEVAIPLGGEYRISNSIIGGRVLNGGYSMYADNVTFDVEHLEPSASSYNLTLPDERDAVFNGCRFIGAKNTALLINNVNPPAKLEIYNSEFILASSGVSFIGNDLSSIAKIRNLSNPLDQPITPTDGEAEVLSRGGDTLGSSSQTSFGVGRIFKADSAPLSGTFVVGDVVYNRLWSGDQRGDNTPLRWKCVASGTPGVWEPIYLNRFDYLHVEDTLYAEEIVRFGANNAGELLRHSGGGAVIKAGFNAANSNPAVAIQNFGGTDIAWFTDGATTEFKTRVDFEGGFTFVGGTADMGFSRLTGLQDGIEIDDAATVLQVQNATGWGAYQDNVYTSGSPFQLVANVKRTLPNNSATVIHSQKPTDITEFYTAADSTITGRNGDGVTILVEFTAKPTSVAATYVDVSIDIGGAVGEIYPRTLGFPKGANVERNVIYHVTGYTLNTWEANGGKVKVVSDGPVDIYNIRHVITRTHKAR